MIRFLATEAKAMTEAARNKTLGNLKGKIEIVRGLWDHAIQKAAKLGLRAVAESELDRVRTQIPAAAREEVIKQLEADGFEVKPDIRPNADVRNVIVSW